MIGRTIGHYDVVAKLGEGGMGEVYRAHDPKLNRDVALKLLPAAFASDPERLARFRREAQLLAALNHPNIGHIYGFEDAGPSTGSGQGASCALVLELVDGPTLADLIQAQGQGPKAQGNDLHWGPGPEARGLPLHDALPIARQIAEALEAAHEQGITHRDLKPANIKVRADGAVKVLDFGLAKALDPAASGSVDPANSPTFTAPFDFAQGRHATQAGVILGTAAYMAPEQARGKAVDKRADIWSFGAVLFEMLTGRRAFDGETVTDMLARILEREPDWSLLPASTPARVRELLHRCLEKDLKKRQRDIGDVRIQLDESLADLSVSGPASSSSATAPAPTIAAPGARSGGSIVKMVAMILVGAALGIGSWTALGPPGAGGSGTAGSSRVSIAMPADVRALNARITPDGRTVVVLGVRRRPDGSEEPRSRIFTRRLDDYELKPLAGTDGASNYAMSPDGTSIAFIATLSEQTSQRQLARVALDGSAPPIKLADWDDSWETTMAWLEDGDLLIVSDGGTKFFRLPSGGGPRKAPMAFDTGGIAGTPTFGNRLPGDRGVFFAMESWGSRGYQLDEWILDPKTGKATRLFETAGEAVYVPTGHVVFTRGETVMAAPFDVSKAAVTGPVTSLFGGVRTRNSWAHGVISLSETGTLVFAPGGRVGTDRRLVAIDATGKVTAFGGDPRSYETRPAVSSDGKQVAVVVSNAQGTYETWVANEGRPAPRRVLALPTADSGDPIWSPDGRWLAYRRTARDANDGVYVQSADGSGEPRVVVKDGSREDRYFASSWAPDNSALLLSRLKAGKSDLMIVALPLPNPPAPPRVLLATPTSEGAAVFSRDGKLVAFVSDETGRPEIYVAAFSAGALGSRTMVSNRAGFVVPAFSADGRRVFYYADPDSLMSVAIDTSKGISATAPVLVHNLRSLRVDQVEWSILPDGRLLAIQKGTGEDDITQFNLMTNWKPNARSSAQTP